MNLQEYYKNCYRAVSNEVDPLSYPSESLVSPLDKEAVDVMFPLNEDTGCVIDLLSRLMRTDNQLERQKILSMLSDESKPSPFVKVDDDVKMSLLKPRSLQSFDEIAEFIGVCNKAIQQLNGNDTNTNEIETNDNENETNINETNVNDTDV